MFHSLLLPFLGLAAPVASAAALTAPLHTDSRWILDSNNDRVKLRCINWATHLETNTVEGLQHQPVADIANRIASYGFNCVRLTWSVELALRGNVTKVEDNFKAAADAFGVPEEDLLALYDDALEINPFVGGTVWDVYAETVNALENAGLGIIMDNHVSKPSWCCNLTDGNGWWDDAQIYFDSTSRYFDTTEWYAGLTAMATFSLAHPAVIGIGLRNEIRGIPVLQDTVGSGRPAWREHATNAINTVVGVNPDLLAIIGGTLGATDYSFLRDEPFDRSAWPDRMVYEYHIYSYSVGYTTDNCDVFQSEMGAAAGYLLEQNEDFTGPLWVSEFGFTQTGGDNSGVPDADWAYFSCLRSYLEGNDADWGFWAVGGDFYIRDGIVSYPESFGLLNNDWSDLRNPQMLSLLAPILNVTQGP